MLLSPLELWVLGFRVCRLQTAVAYQLPASMKAPTELSGGAELTFEEPAYALGPGEEGDFESDILRLTYSSLTTPSTVIDQHLGTGER